MDGIIRDLEVEGPSRDTMTAARLLTSIYGEAEAEDALRNVLKLSDQQVVCVMQQLHAREN